MINWLKNFFGLNTQGVVGQQPTDRFMNEGDLHSGPHGYSPNTEYQETQYGSRFDEDAEWNEEH